MADVAGALDAAAAGDAAAALAVVPAPGRLPEIAWRPSTLEHEPAFLIYSITKTFIATLFLMFAEEARLRLDDPLARWFPAVADANRITLRQLLNHTAGIRDYGPLPAYHEAVRARPSMPWSFERFSTESIEKGLLSAPGSQFAYSNPGYMLLKRIAEKVGGAPFRMAIAERIAGPLGLARTVVAETTGDLMPLAPGRSTLLTPDASAADVRGRYHPGWVSHGVIASTASDVARFFDALASGEIVSRRSLSEMTTLVPVPVADDNPAGKILGSGRPGYGLGLMADSESPWGFIWGHIGGGPGYGASAFHAQDLGGASVCAVTGTEGLDSVRIAAAALHDIGRQA